MKLRFTIKTAATVFATLAFMHAPAAAADRDTLVKGMVYQVPISYDNSLYKEDANVKGAYLYYGYGPDTSYEAAVDFTEITYKPDVDYEQTDYTFVFSKYGKTKKNRYGLHRISSSTDDSDGFTVFTGVADYANPEKTKLVDVYYSRHDVGAQGVKAIQISPAIGTAQYKNGDKLFFALTSLHYIRLDDEVGLEGDNFISIEQAVTFYQENVSVTLDGWLGERMFQVGSDGFAVYNKPELNKGGYGISFKYGLEQDTNISVGWGVEKFKDTYSQNSAKAQKYTFMLGHTF